MPFDMDLTWSERQLSLEFTCWRQSRASCCGPADGAAGVPPVKAGVDGRGDSGIAVVAAPGQPRAGGPCRTMAGSLTQAEIARSTGLSAATVSNIVRELKDGGTVEVTPTSAGGRRARSVSLSGDAGIVVGVDFGHTHLRVAVGNLAHQVLAEEAEPLDVDASSAQGLDRAEQLVSRLIAAPA